MPSISSRSRSATSSRRRWRGAALLALTAAVAAGGPARAKVFLSQEEALALVFGRESPPEKRTAYLTDDQASKIRAEAGSEPPTRIVVSYAGAAGAGRGLTAYFETHLVRTLPETIMVVVGADGRVVRVDVLSFDEPEEYLPKARWLDQFPGRRLDEDLTTKGSIRAVTGATLSSRAITDAVRRVLATHAVLSAGGPAEASP